MSKSHFSQAGNKIHGALHNSGNFFQGKIEGGVIINQLGDKFGAAGEVECEKALFLTNPVDDRSDVRDSNETLITKSCQWIHEQPAFQSWLDNGMDSQLLWISGRALLGKTMLSLFLLQEIEGGAAHRQNPPAVVLFYFVDQRSTKRNTAVSILRGLIWMLIKARPLLMATLLEEFVIQGADLFSQTSLEALWRIFAAMLRDPGTGKVYCVIDGLNECQEDSLKPFLRKVTRFFDEEHKNMQDWRQGNINPRLAPKFASVRMILVSREAPQCLLDNLGSKFPWIQIEKATGGVARTGASSAAAKSSRTTAKTVTQKKATAKLSAIALLALQKKRLAAAQAKESTARPTDPAEGLQHQLTKLSIADSSAPKKDASELPDKTDVIAAVELAADGVTPGQELTDGTTGDGYVFDEVIEDEEIVEEEVEEEVVDVEEGDVNEEDEEVPRNHALSFYIEARMEQLAQGRSYGEALESSITAGLQKKGDGTFLWVDLAIEELRLYEAQYAEQIVEQLPSSLSEMYCRTLRRIPEHTVPLVVAIFHWVLAAHRPLFIPELSTALMQMGFTTTAPFEMVKQGVAACSTMLTINEETSEVKIKHTSVQDFLIDKSGPLWTDAALHRFHVNIEDVDSNIATICLRYLEQGCLNDGPVTMANGPLYWQRVSQFPLLPYAAMFWPEHLRTASRPYIDLSSPFFAKKSAIRKNWWQCYFPATTSKLAILAPRDFTLLHMAAYLNLPFVAQQMEYRGELHSRLNNKDSHGSTPLFWAACQGNMEMFVFLLQRGASKQCVGETIFDVASRKGQVEIVEYLLNHGQDPNARLVELNAFVALGQTARWAHGVLNEGTKLDNDYWKLFVRDIGSQGTAMHMTCLFGHSAVVELLISRGASVHLSTNKGWTALHSASWTGQMDCIKLLLDHGADPQGVTHDGWNSLHCAASRGKHNAVTFYLAYGLPVDVLTSKRKTPLHLAAYMGSAPTIRVLVGAGAYIDAQSYKGETALHLAARSGEPEAVETLLSLGANRYMVNSAGLPPAESLKAIRTGLNMNQREALRILEQYGMPGYVPWQPKVDPNTPASQQQAETQSATSQSPGATTGYNQQAGSTFTANFKFSGTATYYPEEKPHVQRSETFPFASHPTPGLDRRFSNAAPPPPYSPSPAFPQQSYPQEKPPQPVPTIVEQPAAHQGAQTQTPAPFVPLPRKPSFNSLSGVAAAQPSTPVTLAAQTAQSPNVTTSPHMAATPPNSSQMPSNVASASVPAQPSWGSSPSVGYPVTAAAVPTFQPPTPSASTIPPHVAASLNTSQHTPQATPAPVATSDTAWGTSGGGTAQSSFSAQQPAQPLVSAASSPPAVSPPQTTTAPVPMQPPNQTSDKPAASVQPSQANYHTPTPLAQISVPTTTSSAPPIISQPSHQGPPQTTQPPPVSNLHRQHTWSHSAAPAPQPQPGAPYGAPSSAATQHQPPQVQIPQQTGAPPQYGQPSAPTYPALPQSTQPQWGASQPPHPASQPPSTNQPWAVPQPMTKPYTAPAAQPWAPPAPQSTPAPHISPPPSNYGSAPQWTPPPATPAPAYAPSAYPPSPLQQQQQPAYPQAHQPPAGYAPPQQPFSPYQQPPQYQQPGASYQPPQGTAATGYLTVTGYVPGWTGRPQGAGGAGMDFAPPPGMGGPLPHPGVTKKKSIFSLGGIEITRK